MDDRVGWLESCGPWGAVFLDEIGEVDAAVQVKLLRVLQTREFQRIGETAPRRFAGKVIAATNRTLSSEIAAGRFRSDFYYRLCADVITMPTLRAQLADTPDDLGNLLRIVAGRIAGPARGDRIAAAAEAWVSTHLGADYGWPGNMRELEQCVYNIMIRGAYRPLEPAVAPSPSPQGLPTADEVLQHYCASVHAQTGSYLETARLLDLDPRTVRTKVSAWRRRARGGQPVAVQGIAPRRLAARRGRGAATDAGRGSSRRRPRCRPAKRRGEAPSRNSRPDAPPQGEREVRNSVVPCGAPERGASAARSVVAVVPARHRGDDAAPAWPSWDEQLLPRADAAAFAEVVRL